MNARRTITVRPLGFVTETSTVPSPAGAKATSVFASRNSTSLAGMAPKRTVMPDKWNPLPCRTTRVPPTLGPAAGEMAVTASAGKFVGGAMETRQVLLGTRSMVSATSCSPGGRAAAGSRFACATPTVPGVSPRKPIRAGCPPIMALAVPAIRTSAEEEAGRPVDIGVSTGPAPVRKRVSPSPGRSGVSGVFRVPE